MARPKIPLLSPERVVTAALRIIDRDGYEALNMRGLARELGVRDASLYYHFRNKDEILVAVARHLLLSVPLPATPEPWASALVEAATNYRRVMLEHPNAVSVILRFQPRTFILPDVYESFAATMQADGLGPDVILTILDASESLILGWALQITSSLPPRDNAAGGSRLEDLAGASVWGEEERFQRAFRAMIVGLAESNDLARKPAGG